MRVEDLRHRAVSTGLATLATISVCGLTARLVTRNTDVSTYGEPQSVATSTENPNHINQATPKNPYNGGVEFGLAGVVILGATAAATAKSIEDSKNARRKEILRRLERV